MTRTCGDCVCTAPERTPSRGRLVLATQVDHTATALRSLALRRGTRLHALAPGLLELYADDADAFLAEARQQLSSVEADEVRCMVVEQELSESGLLQRAMSAPSLSAAGARVAHADLLPLFADEQGSFHAVYQPIVDLSDSRVVAHEALLRATAPDGAPVFPDVLFPAAEAAGWTHVLDRIGRTTALHQAGPWLGDQLLFINFVPTSIYRPQVCLRTTEQAAHDAGLRLDQLVFEVTEGHLVRDVDHLADVFAYYRERGCRVALDDLGAGYSSLNLLIRLRPDVVKLDKEIVQALPDPVSSAVISAIVDITHAYGGLVLAECVETQEQADVARELGVDLGQGWHFGRPVRPEQTAAVPAAAARPASVDAPARPADPTRPDAAVAVPVPSFTLQPVEPAPTYLTELLERAVESSASGVVVVDMLAADAPMVYVNDAFRLLSGYDDDELLGFSCRMLQGADTDRAAVARLSAAVRQGLEHRAVLRNYRKDGTPWWNELHLSPVHDGQGYLTHYLGFQNDVTARVEAEQRLLHLAAHDALTGLANRATLVEQLEAALATATAEQSAIAVVFLDLDGFKQVNDTYGHAVGDSVLEEVAQRLRSSLRTGDLLARIGGDEFVTVLSGLDPVDAERVALRAASTAIESLQRPMGVGRGVSALSASAGIALYPDHAATGEQLLFVADAAMYDAKAAGAGSVRVGGARSGLWTPELGAAPRQRTGGPA